MDEDVLIIFESTKESMIKAINHLDHELSTLRAGKANPKMLDSIMVDYYGSPTPLSQVANINTPDAKTIAIQPWERKMIDVIEKAIMVSNIGLTPSNNGEIIRLNIPALTEERRKELVKKSKNECEHARVSIRNARRDAIEEIKKLQKNGYPEDLAKDKEAEIQKMTDDYSKRVDILFEQKEKEILAV